MTADRPDFKDGQWYASTTAREVVRVVPTMRGDQRHRGYVGKVHRWDAEARRGRGDFVQETCGCRLHQKRSAAVKCAEREARALNRGGDAVN